MGNIQDAEELSSEALQDALKGLQAELNQEANPDPFWSETKLNVSESFVPQDPPTAAPASIECSVIKVNKTSRRKPYGNKEARAETVYTDQDENDKSHAVENSNQSPSWLSEATSRPGEFSIIQDSTEPHGGACESQLLHGHQMNPGELLINSWNIYIIIR